MFQCGIIEEGRNIVYKIGFGHGPLKVMGATRMCPFLLPPSFAREAFFIDNDRLEDIVTFDWFKVNFICPGRPWICEEFPVVDPILLSIYDI